MSERRKFTDYEKKTVYAKANGCCALCGMPVKYNKMTIDHKIPLSHGGTNEICNLQLACLSCNRAKQDISEKDFPAKIWKLFWHNRKAIAMFHFKRFIHLGKGVA